MSDLLDFVVEAHGGLERWSKVTAVTVAALRACRPGSLPRKRKWRCRHSGSNWSFVRSDENRINLRGRLCLKTLYDEGSEAGHHVAAQRRMSLARPFKAG